MTALAAYPLVKVDDQAPAFVGEWWEEDTFAFLDAADPRWEALIDLDMTASEMWSVWPEDQRLAVLAMAFLRLVREAAANHHERPYNRGPISLLIATRKCLAVELGRFDTIPYKLYLRTQRWQALRRAALDRDGRRCRLCDSSESLNVHHRTYARRGYERLEDLTTLCRDCHAKFHDK